MPARTQPHVVLAHIGVGVVVHDRDTRFLFANDTACRLLGLVETELLSRTSSDLPWQVLTPDGAMMAAGDDPVSRAVRTKAAVRDVVLGLRRQGGSDRVWLRITAVPTIDAAGEVDAVYSTFTDVTGIADTTRALEVQRAMLSTVTDAVPGVVYQHVLRQDDTDAFPFISARVTELLGATPEAIRRSALKLWERVHPDDRARVRDAILAEAKATRAAAQRRPSYEQRFDAEFRVQTPDRQWRWVRAQSRGTAVGSDVVCQGLMTDITEWRMLSDQVRAAQRQELIGTLVAGIAHNFNNMLAAILPNLDRARRRATGELQQELNDAHDAAESAAELVRHLMLLVRRDEPRSAEPIDAGALVQDVMRMCRRTFNQRIALETTTPPTPLVVLGRRSELQQVILNLCINARDAVEDAPVPVIEAEVASLPGQRVGITVRDTGVGMTAEAQRRVGQPFFTTKPPGKGTGLGLATALGIVREMGGDLTWTSKLGAGTTFEIVLPQAPGGEPQALGPPRAPRKRFAGQAVLVIDDEPLVRNTLERLLSGLGLAPIVTASGPEGLAVLRDRDDVAAALVDLSMPEMSGAEVLQRIAAVRPSLPVFVVSGWVADPDALAAARGVIQKPFTSRDLIEALGPVLN
jgi:PAS domain S-box-containing protein